MKRNTFLDQEIKSDHDNSQNMTSINQDVQSSSSNNDQRILIDTTHAEEIRAVFVSAHGRVERFDVESNQRRRLKGNIYLAKVVRVEPSLQAAFVDYGVERHGFLSFNEIHLNYYQIPIADRAIILAKMTQATPSSIDSVLDAPLVNEEDESEITEQVVSADISSEEKKELNERSKHDESEDCEGISDNNDNNHNDDDNDNNDYNNIDTKGNITKEERGFKEDRDRLDEEDLTREEVIKKQKILLREYRIQEVIKRQQIILVQVIKEERGNKGAALTTYISIPGRYCVLMPNTPQSRGVSRKIISESDRKRLKKIVDSIDVVKDMGLIVRTAGANRTKLEIRKDYEYLKRLWSDVTATTMTSIAPCCVHEEGNLIKRSLRDFYDRGVKDILVEGEEGYKQAKNVMKMLMPSQAKIVKQHKESVSLFNKYGIDKQLEGILEPIVPMSSGAYLVINTTEALVSIDVNSGKATKERSIESMALRVNLEATEEVARQLRLRDLSGLIVVDFIDMSQAKNNHLIEKKLREFLKMDRARIQVGCISRFGLLELSRQRIRAALSEDFMHACSTCGGSGFLRSVESMAIRLLRSIEEGVALAKNKDAFLVEAPLNIFLYILNHKRSYVDELERRWNTSICFNSGPYIEQHASQVISLGDADASVEELSSTSSLSLRKNIPAVSPTAAFVENSSIRYQKRKERRDGFSLSYCNTTTSNNALPQKMPTSAEYTHESGSEMQKFASTSSDRPHRRQRQRKRRQGGERQRHNNSTNSTNSTKETKKEDVLQSNDRIQEESKNEHNNRDNNEKYEKVSQNKNPNHHSRKEKEGAVEVKGEKMEEKDSSNNTPFKKNPHPVKRFFYRHNQNKQKESERNMKEET